MVQKCFLTLLLLLSPSYVCAQGESEFPEAFRGAWAEDLSACEPEFTGGFTIERDSIGYYEGVDQLLDVRSLSLSDDRSAITRTLIVDLLYDHLDEASKPTTEMFLLINGNLFRRGMSDEASLTPPTRYLRCPVGSTISQVDELDPADGMTVN